MNFFELDVSYFRSNESFFVGLFHGSLFSFPLSIPSLFLISSKTPFFVSLSVLLMSVFVFFGLMCHCPRPLLQFWMSTEPGFMLLGLYVLSRIRQLSLLHATSTGSSSAGYLTRLRGIKFGLMPSFAGSAELNSIQKWSESFSQIFLFILPHILFVFFNPVFPAMLSKILVSQDILEHITNSYFLGFITSALCFFTLHRMLWTFGGPQILQGIRHLVHFSRTIFNHDRDSADPALLASSTAKLGHELNSGGQIKTLTTQISAFCFMGLFIHGFLHASWRIFVQYPLEFIPTSPQLAQSGAKTLSLVREFPSFDSSIRHREKNLPVERHLPIERMQSRRTLSGRPAFNEEQKSDAALKYNSFFLNAFEHFCLDGQLNRREGQILQASSNQTSTSTKLVTSSELKDETKVIENTAKGKPKFSYIGNRIFGALNGRAKLGITIVKPGLSYLHDDLSVLHAILKLA
jgi:hypothetical protein